MEVCWNVFSFLVSNPRKNSFVNTLAMAFPFTGSKPRCCQSPTSAARRGVDFWSLPWSRPKVARSDRTSSVKGAKKRWTCFTSLTSIRKIWEMLKDWLAAQTRSFTSAVNKPRKSTKPHVSKACHQLPFRVCQHICKYIAKYCSLKCCRQHHHPFDSYHLNSSSRSWLRKGQEAATMYKHLTSIESKAKKCRSVLSWPQAFSLRSSMSWLQATADVAGASTEPAPGGLLNHVESSDADSQLKLNCFCWLEFQNVTKMCCLRAQPAAFLKRGKYGGTNTPMSTPWASLVSRRPKSVARSIATSLGSK